MLADIHINFCGIEGDVDGVGFVFGVILIIGALFAGMASVFRAIRGTTSYPEDDEEE